MNEDQRRIRAFVDEERAARPIEDKIVRMIWKAMRRAGKRIVRVDYGDGAGAPVSSLRQLYDEVFNLDEAWLLTEDGGYVFLVMGQADDILTDYTRDLEDALKPVNNWIETRW